MEKLLALIMNHTHNVHILHWKTTGPGFQENHEYLDELYEEMTKQIDVVAEIMLQRNENPLSYHGMMEILVTLDEPASLVNPTQSYDGDMTFKLVIDIFNQIIECINNLYEDNSIDRVHQSQLEEIQSWYMLRAKYLLPKRLVRSEALIANEGSIFNFLAE